MRMRLQSHSVWLLLVALWLAPAQAAAPVRILAFGDSLTAGYGLLEGQGYVELLAKALKAQGLSATIENGGVSGDTTAGGLARLDWALSDNPQIVILELGANDALRGLPPADTAKNLDAMLDKLAARKITVLLLGMLAPPNLGKEYGDEFNAIYPRLAKAHGVAFDPFVLDGVAANPALNQADGIHPNAEGARIMARKILPYLFPLVKSAAAAAP
jgi:acyl-CoA thioesterase I